MLIAIAIAGAIAGIIVFRAEPRLAFFVWAVALFLVPIWIGFSVGYFYSAIGFATILCLASASLRGFRWTAVDTVVLGFVVIITASFVLGGVTTGHLLIALVSWCLPYAFGRVVLARLSFGFIASCIAGLTVIVAVLAILEFITSVNPFVLVHWNSSGYALWSPLQHRGGFLRVEGAFGHSIALGACLSMGGVFVLAARWSLAARVASLVAVGGAVVVTFSRIGLVSLALGLLLSLAFLGHVLGRRTRFAVASLGIVGALVAIPFVGEVFSAAGDEAQGSALYRFDLLSLLSYMSPFGLSPAYHVLPNGDVYIGDFQSIDSALVLIGLRLGWVPLILVFGLLVAAVIAVFRTRSNVALIAFVAQIPTLATVDLITQLPYLLFFVAGLAVSLYILDRNSRARGNSVSDVKALVPERSTVEIWSSSNRV